MVELVGGILIAGAILAALAAIGKALWWLWMRVLRPLAQFVEDWQGEPAREGISPGRPGALARLTAIEDRQTAIEEKLAEMTRLDQRLTAVEVHLRPTNPNASTPTNYLEA